MTSPTHSIPVVDVDQVFPFLTSGTPSGGGYQQSTGTDQAPSVRSVIRDVLGWRPRPQDTKAFTAALTASFTLTEDEGHMVATYVPRGLATQADLGVISGGQASLYTRAESAFTQITRLLDGLIPLSPDADQQDCDAFRLLVRHGISRLVSELGNPGGPRQPLVDSAFDMLAGALRGTDAAERRNALAGITADSVPGQLGALRVRFGLLDANVNNVDREAVRTSFWTLVDLVIDLRRSWEEWKVFLSGGNSMGFLGTDLVLISRLMAAAAEQVDEVEAVFDSVQVTAAERQTLMLGGKHTSGLTLDGLLSWVKVFLTEDGPMYARESGRDGMRTSFAPTAEALLRSVRHSLVHPIGSLELGSEPANGAAAAQSTISPMRWIPVQCSQKLPAGLYSARSRIAVAGLCRLLTDLFETSARISRYPGVVLFDVQFQSMLQVDGPQIIRVSVRGANLRPSYLPAFKVERKQIEGHSVPPERRYKLVRPLNDSVSWDNDTLVGLFRADEFQDWENTGDSPTTLLKQQTGSVAMPAEILPIVGIDGETGRVIDAPPTLTWPKLTPPPSVPGRPPNWDDLPYDSDFPASFDGSTPTPNLDEEGSGTERAGLGGGASAAPDDPQKAAPRSRAKPTP